MSATRLIDLICARTLGALFASVGAMFLVQLPSYYQSEVAFKANAISTTGTVVQTREERHYSGGGGLIPLTSTIKYISTIEFQTRQGESVEFTTSRACSSRRDCKNKTVQVQYVPSVPDQARLYSGTALNVRVGGRGVFSLIFFSIGIGLLVIDLSDRQKLQQID